MLNGPHLCSLLLRMLVNVSDWCPDRYRHVSSQWLAGDEAEAEGVAEEGDEDGAVQGDDHQAGQLLLITQLFVQDFFFSILKGNILWI